jgi:hypothetical protein
MKKRLFLGVRHGIFYQLSIYVERIIESVARLAEQSNVKLFRIGDKTALVNQTRAVIHSNAIFASKASEITRLRSITQVERAVG